MKEMKWENFEELLKYAEKNGSENDWHSEEWWAGYNECLSMMGANLFPKEYFDYLMKKWSKPFGKN